MVRLVLFDVGGVLIDLRSEQARRSLESEYGMTTAAYEGLSRCTYEKEPFSITEEATIGAAESDKYIDAFRAACGCFVPASVMKQNREGIIGHERAPMIELVSMLSEKVRVAAFTNTIEMHWKMLQNRDRFSFPAIVEQTIASHVIGVAKPTQAAYQEVTRRLEIDPAEVLFIDDSGINVSAAIEYGMRGIVFNSYRDLVETLHKEKLLPSRPAG
jgi:putative hydrolase of the HAD superfamily